MIVLALGSNLPSTAGPPATTLSAALGALRQAGIVPVAVSRFFVTPAWPDPRDPAFINAVACVETSLTPAALLAELHRIEEQFGRTRAVLNAPRTLDLDILDYHGRVETGPPELPHPRMAKRGFVLIPLADVAPGWCHPVLRQNLDALIAALPPSERNVQELG